MGVEIPIRPEKPYHHGALRASLLKAGEDALAELPLEKVSLREIARRAGVSHAAPKHHFATMAELLAEIAARGFDRFVEALGGAAERSPDQTSIGRLKAMGRAYLSFAAQNKAAYGLMFGSRGSTAITPNLARASYAAWDQLERAVSAVVGPAQAVPSAVMVWSTVHGLAMLQADNRLPPNVSPQAAVEATLQLMVTGLGNAST